VRNINRRCREKDGEDKGREHKWQEVGLFVSGKEDWVGAGLQRDSKGRREGIGERREGGSEGRGREGGIERVSSHKMRDEG
jgi:hypothetical protein